MHINATNMFETPVKAEDIHGPAMLLYPLAAGHQATTTTS